MYADESFNKSQKVAQNKSLVITDFYSANFAYILSNRSVIPYSRVASTRYQSFCNWSLSIRQLVIQILETSMVW